LLSVSFCFGQGTVRGKITDNTGEALIGATVVIKAKTSSGVMADLDGNYSIKVTDTTEQTIVVSYVSYKNQEFVVHPINGEVIVKDFVLVSASTLDEVIVTTKATKANNYYMENIKMKSSSTMDYISQETMKKTGDVNVVNAVARVSGVSASSNAGFITVRGIGDRYVKTTLNGSRIPTLDPFTNNIRLDLFPAFLVDNIILTKTASPDLPGDWAGAYLSIETKDYPDKLTVNFETSAGYVPQSTFKNVISSEHSSTDWLGYDNGFRDHTHNPNGPSPIVNNNPNQYQEFVGLGLGSYYNSIGVTGSTPWNSTYFNLGLVQLGLLQNSQLGDQAAITHATNQFNSGPYQSQAFAAINANAVKFGQSFKDNWSTTTRQALPNFTQNLSVGNQVNLFGKPLGFLLGFRYNSSTQYDPNSVLQRVTSTRAYEYSVNQQVSQENNAWSGLLNLAYKYHANHSIAFMFMPNFIGTNNARYGVDNSDPAENVVAQTKFYEQRKQLIYQLKSEHYIAKPQLKIELNASYTDGKSSAPDFTDVYYLHDPISNSYQIGGTIGNGLHRYFRYLSDNLFDSRLSAEMPIGKSDKGPRKIKFGGAYQYNNRKSDQYDYVMGFNTGTTNAPSVMSNENLNQYFSLNNFGIQNNGVNFYYVENGSPAYHTFGNSSILAGYLMTDYSITNALRIAGGVRVEQANIFTDSHKFDSLHYAVNDPRRSYSTQYPLLNPGKLNTLNYLPSANVIYKLRKDDDAPINLRANFSQTVARPSIRELSDVAIFDYTQRNFVFGNSDLKPVQIKNYDLRFEWYFKNRDNFSVGGFYKDFKNHIELVNAGPLTWLNANKSYVVGIEIEGKKSIIKNLDLIANATFANSNSNFTRQRISVSGQGAKEYTPLDVVNHPMFGQAPYVINVILSYSLEKAGLNATISYNVQGRRLAISSAITSIPDVYEMPRNMFDFKVMKKLGKHFTASLTIRDILNTAIRRAYIYSDGTQIDYDKYRYGTNYVLSIAYKL
ncbi:MAG TPA: TonB-dependent receptor, partial [Bacteroidia bacterium]|nr:TonB-dependent receptor [Bacteroidia bacterium]